MLNIGTEIDLGIFVTATLLNNFHLLSDNVANVGYVSLNKVVLTTKLTSEIPQDVHILCNGVCCSCGTA
jgi:hypothetical protein